MALINDGRLFTGGSERINTAPHVQLYAQLMQRKQAREEAMDQYYQNLYKSINPAGMRTKDIDSGWSKKVQDWTAHTMQNRDILRNPKTPEQRAVANRNMSMYQDILMDTNKSKEAGAQEMELAKQKISGKWNPTQDDMDVSDSISASIYDDKYYKDPGIRTKPYTLNDLSLNIPQVTPKEQEEYYKAAVGNLKPKEKYDETRARRDKVTGQVFVPFESSYEPDMVKKISENAGVLFPGNRTPIGVHYDHLLHDPAFFKEANEAFQSVYGPDAVVDTPKKAAQAAAIMNTKADVSTGEKPFKDEDLAFQRNKEMADYRHGLAVALKKTPGAKAEGSDDDNLYLQQYWDGAVEKALSNPENERQGNVLRGGEYQLEIDPVIAKAFIRQGLEPEEMTVTKEGVVTPKYYTNVDDGKGGTKKVLVAELSKPMTRTQALLTMGVKATTGKQRYAEGKAAVDEKKGTYHIKGKDYSEGDLIKMGYTIDQIKPYRK